MRKAILATVVLVVLMIMGVTFYLLNDDVSGLSRSAKANPDNVEQVQKNARPPDDFDRQFQNRDGTIDKVAVNGYVDREIASAENQVKSLAVGSEERIKAERRMNMLKVLKQRMNEAK